MPPQVHSFPCSLWMTFPIKLAKRHQTVHATWFYECPQKVQRIHLSSKRVLHLKKRAVDDGLQLKLSPFCDHSASWETNNLRLTWRTAVTCFLGERSWASIWKGHEHPLKLCWGCNQGNSTLDVKTTYRPYYTPYQDIIITLLWKTPESACQGLKSQVTSHFAHWYLPPSGMPPQLEWPQTTWLTASREDLINTYLSMECHPPWTRYTWWLSRNLPASIINRYQ